ncbi:MAG: hypothetical protein Q9191_007873, partial [Dirinaria sp. TL-2023a]
MPPRPPLTESPLLSAIKSTPSIWSAFAIAVFCWLYLVNKNVPQPYLDEFFHVQQAQLYLQGRWNAWHPKITTPPGLYLLSYVQVSFGAFLIWSGTVTVTWLRYLNFDLGAFFMPYQVLFTAFVIADSYDVQSRATNLRSKVERGWSKAIFRHTAFNICLFPPLFFFYGLYYTDVASALSVICAYRCYLMQWRKRFILAGLLSLFFRQTNIFWVSLYTGGIEVLRALPGGRPNVEYPKNPTFFDVVAGSWQHGCVYAPLVNQANFQEYLMSGISLVIAVLLNLRIVFRAFRPFFLLLAAFGAFVMWNGGVVLGDKENHVASIHLAQMLYIWPYFTFFSLPMLYPWLLNLFIPDITILPKRLRLPQAKTHAPSLLVSIAIMTAMLAIVHYNTIIHPFTLADNRHYMFYIFRLLLLSHPAIKYLSVPIYFLCAWAVLTALAGPDHKPTNPNIIQTRIRNNNNSNKRLKPPATHPWPKRGNSVPFVLIWLLATSLSLATAPLVEPRYFILPWLVWRLHLMAPQPVLRRVKMQRGEDEFRITKWDSGHDHKLWLETAWFVAINAVTGYVFLYRGFAWPQEVGRVQRFM